MDDIDESRSRTSAKKTKTSKMTKKEEVRKTTGAKKPMPKTDDPVNESEKETGSEETPKSESKSGCTGQESQENGYGR